MDQRSSKAEKHHFKTLAKKMLVLELKMTKAPQQIRDRLMMVLRNQI